jgi:hypothetical protein
MIRWMINRLSKRVVIVSIIGLGIAALGLVLRQDWLYFAGLIVASPLFLFYAIPMIIVILWVFLVSWWCPWKPHFIYFKEDEKRENKPSHHTA